MSDSREGLCMAPCVPPCGHRACKGGLCEAHLSRKRRGGDMTKPVRSWYQDGPIPLCECPAGAVSRSVECFRTMMRDSFWSRRPEAAWRRALMTYGAPAGVPMPEGIRPQAEDRSERVHRFANMRQS